MKLRILFVLFSVHAHVFAFSQQESGLQVLANIRSFYQDAESFEMTLKYEYFEKGKLIESLPAEIKTKGNLYYSSVGPHISLNNKNCFIHVDGENKRINVYAPQKSEIKDYLKLPMDSTLQYIQQILLDTVDSKGRIRVHYLPGMKVSYTEFYYDLNTFALFSCGFHMQSEEGAKVELRISFFTYSAGVKDAKKVFDESNYILIESKDKIVPKEQYKSYELNNYLNLEK